MMYKYVFHKESQSELEEFIKIAATSQKNNQERYSQLSTYLKELQSQRELETGNSEQPQERENEEIITISDSQNDSNITETKTDVQDAETDQLNFSETADLTEIVAENLIKEKNISQDNLRKLGSNCNDKQIETFILAIKEQLDVKSVCNFGKALCDCESEEVNRIFNYFYKYFLYPLLSREQSAIFQETFVGVFKKFHRQIKTDDIIKNLLSVSCTGIFLENISKLDAEYKNEILRDVTLNCRQVEAAQIKVLECLLDQNTHHTVIKLILDLLLMQGESNDKAIGKFIVSLMQILGRKVYQFEQPLRQLIAKHKSLWKTKMKKVFAEHYECSQLSQSLIKH